MTTTATQPDTQDMVIVHRVFRREFGLLPELIDKVADGNVPRAKLLAEHCADLAFGLHHHHQSEDELLWPLLHARAATQQDLIERMEEQHRAMTAALERVEALLPVWAADARTADRDELSAALRQVKAILDLHLDEEESKILPLVREHLTVEQWDALGKRGAEALEDKAKRLLFLGMILEDASPREQADFLSRLPIPARILWRALGRRSYATYVTRVRGT